MLLLDIMRKISTDYENTEQKAMEEAGLIIKVLKIIQSSMELVYNDEKILFTENWKVDQKRLCPNWSTPAPATPANDTPSAKHWAFIILNDTPAAKHWASSILDYAPNIQRLAFSV